MATIALKRLIILLALGLTSSVASAQPGVSVSVTVNTFDDRLSPYGAWLVLPGYGRVWQPDVEYVGDGFYPYGSGGHWVYTDAGWVFDSEYPFGWAVFHYGRWMLDPDYGWVWVPGRKWAPAWVTWRTGGTYVGWAPMGPRGVLNFHRNHWLFVETGHLTVVNVRSYALDERRFTSAVTITRPVHGAVPIGPAPAYVTAATRLEVRAVPINDVRGGSRVIPAPPPPEQRRERVATPIRSRPPPPANLVPEPRPNPPPARVEPGRQPPPMAQPGRAEPRGAPPPQPERAEPRAPPRQEPDPRFVQPPPARVEPERGNVPPQQPSRMEPDRPRGPGFSPPPALVPQGNPPPGSPGQPAPPPAKKKAQPGPGGPPAPAPRRR